MSSCLPCTEINPCLEITCPDCNKPQCNNCAETYDSNCVFITDKLLCVNGMYYIDAGISLNDALMQLICKINELEARIIHIQTNCCPAEFCDLVTIVSVT